MQICRQRLLSARQAENIPSRGLWLAIPSDARNPVPRDKLRKRPRLIEAPALLKRTCGPRAREKRGTAIVVPGSGHLAYRFIWATCRQVQVVEAGFR